MISVNKEMSTRLFLSIRLIKIKQNYYHLIYNLEGSISVTHFLTSLASFFYNIINKIMINFTDHSKTKELDGSKKQAKIILNKYSSEPKLTSLKDEILKIPKVKQILQKDRFIYAQDIEKRIELIGNIKNEQFEDKEVAGLHELRKPMEKKSKRHKTNFKIPLTRKNIQSLNNLVKEHIKHNQLLKNEEKIFLKEYSQNAPFDLQRLKFMDDLNPIKRKFKEMYPDFKEGVLAKNKLTLQQVILNRNIKREMKLDQKKVIKEHSKKILGMHS